MKTQTKFILAALVLALVSTGSAVADDPQLRVIDNHHGASIYLARPAPVVPTIAFGGHAKGNGNSAPTVKRAASSPSEPKLGFRVVTTPHGSVSYFAPAT